MFLRFFHIIANTSDKHLSQCIQNKKYYERQNEISVAKKKKNIIRPRNYHATINKVHLFGPRTVWSDKNKKNNPMDLYTFWNE